MKKTRTKIAILPKLVDCEGDTSKRWYVIYFYRQVKTGKMVRFRLYEGLNDGTKVSRYKNAEILIKEYTDKIVNGWNPFDEDKDILYEDQLKYHNIVEQQKIRKGKIRMLDTCINIWLKERSPLIAKSTYQTYQSKFRVLLDWMKKVDKYHLDISSFTPDDANQFVNWLFDNRKLSRNMVKQYLLVIGQVYRSMIKKGLLLRNPFADINIKGEEKIPAKYFVGSILEKVKNEIMAKDTQLWFVCQLQYYCFIRPIEIRYLLVSDIDMEGNSITIRPEIAKSRKKRILVIPAPLKEFLSKMKIESYPGDHFLISIHGTPERKPVSKNYMYNHWCTIRDNLGLSKDYKLYSFKHTGAVRLSRHASIKDIQMQLGHHSLDQVDQYLRQMKASDSEDIRDRFPTI